MSDDGSKAPLEARGGDEFRPIPVPRVQGRAGRLAFQFRLLLDLQLLTIWRFLRPRLGEARGEVLDVGCGEMPYRGLFGDDVAYVGIDVGHAGTFGMRGDEEILHFDGVEIPFPDGRFDQVLCTEVLEHAENPDALVAEMHRVLKPGGVIVATVPFAARVHYEPYDFNRFTRFRLARMFAGFDAVEIQERGDDLATIANKIIVVAMRLTPFSRGGLWRTPLLLVVGPAAVLSLVIAHLSLWLGWGSRADPLGYAIVARKPA